MTAVATKAANNVRLLVIVIVVSWLVAALGFCIIEGASILDGLYWAMTTMSTVGYGDLSPATAFGKVWTIAFQAWSIFYLVPCAVANIIDRVRVDEAKFTHAEQEWQEQTLKAIADQIGVRLADSPEDY